MGTRIRITNCYDALEQGISLAIEFLQIRENEKYSCTQMVETFLEDQRTGPWKHVFLSIDLSQDGINICWLNLGHLHDTEPNRTDVLQIHT